MSIWKSSRNGENGATGATGERGPAGALVYEASGLVASAKIWSGTATTNASGRFTADYTAAGFTEAPRVQATCIGPGAAAGDARNASWISAPTTTSATGIVTSPTTAVLGLIPLQLVGAGVIVHITAVGK